jgi:hypothetical protein
MGEVIQALLWAVATIYLDLVQGKIVETRMAG